MLRERRLARARSRIFYRTHAQSRVLEEALRAAQLPYTIVGGMRFFERAEVKDLLAYLRVIANPPTTSSLLRIINTPARGIGKTTSSACSRTPRARRHGRGSALQRGRRDPAHNAGARKRLERFARLLDRAARAGAREGAARGASARTVLEQTGYVEALRAEDSAEADARTREPGARCSARWRSSSARPRSPRSRASSSWSRSQTDADRATDRGAQITLDDRARRQGPRVPGGLRRRASRKRLFPHAASAEDDEPEDLEEERRLAYVAFTRARQRLFLSYASARRVYGDALIRRRSRFLDEAPAEELHLVGVKRVPAASSGYGGGDAARRPSGNGGYASSYSQASKPREREPRDGPYVDRSEANDVSEIYLGMRVRHSKFGVGEVTGWVAGCRRVTVKFSRRAEADRQQLFDAGVRGETVYGHGHGHAYDKSRSTR